VNALSAGIFDSTIAAMSLRRVLPEWQGNPIPVYALTETRLLPAKTQRFIEFLQEHLGQQASPSMYVLKSAP
jgi:DNA-binding transcriptional LysR family regulator